MNRARLFDLLARQAQARAARAGLAAADARNRQDTAEAASARIGALMAALDTAGPTTAGALALQRRVTAELSAELARQQGLATAAESRAREMRRALAGHDRRRTRCAELADAERRAAETEAQQRLAEAIPPRPAGR